MDPIPAKIVADEFDYKGVSQVVYKKNGGIIA